MTHLRFVPPVLLVLAGLALAPAASASVTVTLVSEEPGNSAVQTGVVEVVYSTVAQVRVKRATAGATTGPIVVEALASAPVQGFVAGAGCALESASRVVCAGTSTNRPRSFAARAFASSTDTSDAFVVAPSIAAPPNNSIQTGLGRDIVNLGDAQPSQANAGDARWTVDGGDGDDQLVGSLGPDILRGGTGNDRIEPRERVRTAAPVDEINGGPGIDTADFSKNHPDALGITRSTTAAPLSAENLIGTSGADILTGDGSANFIDGGNGNDRIRGGGANDLILGGGGADNVLGEDGDDQIGGFRDVAQPSTDQGSIIIGDLREPLPSPDFDLAPTQDGIDTLDGGTGSDLIKAQGDGLVDSVDCGTNGTRTLTVNLGGRLVTLVLQTVDRAILDLVDREDGDCETVDRSDKNERGTVQVVPRRVKGSRLIVGLACPRSARTTCKGRVGLYFGRPSTTMRGGKAYRLARGTSRTVRLRAPRGSGVLRLRALENGRVAPRTVDLRLSR